MVEIAAILPEDIKSLATSAARVVAADEIDATFKSQYTGTASQSLAHDVPLANTYSRSNFCGSWIKSPRLQR